MTIPTFLSARALRICAALYTTELGCPMLSRMFAILLVLLSLHASQSLAQTITRIDAARGPSCAGCRIELTKLVSLGSLSDPDNAGFYSYIAIDREGKFFVTSGRGKVVLVYDQAGKFLRTLGRGGQGPGEFVQAFGLAFGANDSLFVTDGFRVHVFSPTLQFVRQVHMSYPIAGPIVPLPSGEMVWPILNATAQTYPLNIIGANGQIVRSTGTEQPIDGVTCPACASKVFGPSITAGHFWAATKNRYEIELWSGAGKLARRVSVEGSPWFQPWTAPGSVNKTRYQKPFPKPKEIFEDETGRLWMNAEAAVPDWKEPPQVSAPATGGGPRGGGISMADARPDSVLMRLKTSIIEVLDPATARVVVSQRFNGRALRMISPKHVLEWRADDNGLAIADIYIITIKQP